MAKTYRLDIRFIPEPGVNALRRIERLIATMSADGFNVSDMAVFDDAMRVSMCVDTENGGRAELKLLALVSATGSIGRFSCRDAAEVEAEADNVPEQAETALV